MTFWEWLNTPAGIEFTHAVIGLLVVVTGVIAYKNHQSHEYSVDLMRRHLREHELERALHEEPPD